MTKYEKIGATRNVRRHRCSLVFMVITLMIAVVRPVRAQSHGVPVDGYPNWRERSVLVLTNTARMAPTDYRDSYMIDWLADPTGILEGYPATDPVYWNFELNQVARFHSSDIANTPGCPLSHYSCDGTTPHDRVGAAYSGHFWGEVLAWGASFDDPRGAVNIWLCETFSGVCAADFNFDSHRAVMMDALSDEAGVGYAEGTNGGSVWTLDFGRDVAFSPASPIVSASHLFLNDGLITYFLNYFDDGLVGPQSVTLVLDGVEHSADLDNGQSFRGTYKIAQTLASGCRSYHFVVVDSIGQSWLYPEDGEFRTFNEAGCTEDYLATSSMIFGDDFESGGFSMWSAVVGGV